MAKKKVYISFDFDHDRQLKEDLIGQARKQESPFSISDHSLKEAYPNPEWVSRAQQAISKCDVVIVVVGQNTHNAQGVLREVAIARGYRKPIFQLRTKGKTWGGVKGAGTLYAWTWSNLGRAFNAIGE